jgi:DNA-binding MarR family transcriptional regulator
VSALKDEIAQHGAFSGPEEEALLNLLRTADCLQRAMQHQIRTWGITATQYNVLRILRGAEPRGLTCSAIGDRMITAEPDITRLLARLRALKLIRQHRDKQDKRVVWTQISAAGLALLKDSDPAVLEFPRELLGHLSSGQLATLIDLLEQARSKCGGPRTPVACDGTGETCST